MHNLYILGLLMRKFDKVSARLSFSPNYCRAVAETAIKHLVFMCHEAMSVFWVLKKVPNLVYFWVFKIILCLTPRHIPIKVPPGVFNYTQI